MGISGQLQEKILKAISEIGSEGAAISDVAKRVNLERHTISKYLSFMETGGLIYHKSFGRTAVWFLNKIPLKTALRALPQEKTFVEKVLSEIISSMPGGLAVIDKDYNILFMNRKMTEEYGSREGEKFYKAIIGLENPLKLKKVGSVIEEKTGSSELEIADKNNRMLHIKATKLANPDNSISIILMTEDVTERKMAEERIVWQNALLEAEREAINRCAIFSETDLKGTITDVNDMFAKISKYKKEELIGQNHRIINSGYHPKEFFKGMWSTITRGRVWHGEIKNKAKDGSFYWVDAAIAPVLGQNEKPIKYISIRFDITKAKESRRAS